jgi:hypothetical protein
MGGKNKDKYLNTNNNPILKTKLLPKNNFLELGDCALAILSAK